MNFWHIVEHLQST